jgi:SAM-dependent methyltransferase
MNKFILPYMRKFRAVLLRTLKPSTRYFLATRSLEPMSKKFGYDRGKPIDRYFIETFLKRNSQKIHGTCLEITDTNYIDTFGTGVTHADALDIDTSNRRATIHADLRHMPSVGDNTYDCIILTHVLGIIDDVPAAVSECYRILKPGGTILATSSCLSPVYDQQLNYWRFTVASMRYLFGKSFPPQNIEVLSYGNVLTGQCFWVGMSQEELSETELSYNDPMFPNIIAVTAVK